MELPAGEALSVADHHRPVLIRSGSCYDGREREDPCMGATRQYVVIDPSAGKIDRSIFSEQAVYDDEMEKIFGRAWLMIGHESLVPAVDDFFHTYMGEDPGHPDPRNPAIMLARTQPRHSLQAAQTRGVVRRAGACRHPPSGRCRPRGSRNGRRPPREAL